MQREDPSAAQDFERTFVGRTYGTVLADPPWQFLNRTGKVAPEHRRLSRYPTLTQAEIEAIPVASACADAAHLYLWVPNALLQSGLDVMEHWGFTYKTNLVWHKVRKDGGPDGRGVGFYFRNTTELVLFGVRGKLRTLPPGRRQVNIIRSRKREHSRKPDELYEIIEACSPGPYLELFARGRRSDLWTVWGDQSASYEPDWPTYANASGGIPAPRRPGSVQEGDEARAFAIRGAEFNRLVVLALEGAHDAFHRHVGEQRLPAGEDQGLPETPEAAVASSNWMNSNS